MKQNFTSTTGVFGIMIALAMTAVACSDDAKPKDSRSESAVSSNKATPPAVPAKPAAADDVAAAKNVTPASQATTPLAFVGSFKNCRANPTSDNPYLIGYIGNFFEYDGSTLTAFGAIYTDSQCNNPKPCSADVKDMCKIQTVYNYTSRPSKINGAYDIEVNAHHVLIGVVDNHLTPGDSEGGVYDGSTPEKQQRKLAPVSPSSPVKISGHISDYLPK